MNATDEFFVGWEDRAPVGVARRVRRTVAFLLPLAMGPGASLALAQRTIGTSVFEWGSSTDRRCSSSWCRQTAVP
jgi:hypothetical protein